MPSKVEQQLDTLKKIYYVLMALLIVNAVVFLLLNEVYYPNLYYSWTQKFPWLHIIAGNFIMTGICAVLVAAIFFVVGYRAGIKKGWKLHEKAE